MKQIHWERWSRFYLPRGHPYLWSRARRVTQPQPRVYNMIREELALVKQNGAWKPRRKKGWSGLFYPPNGLNFQFCWFNLIFLIAPSWSESNFFFFFIRSELVQVDPSWSGPTFVPTCSGSRFNRALWKNLLIFVRGVYTSREKMWIFEMFFTPAF